VDAAIIALPHHLHAPVSLHLLAQGIHLLVEKPMALTAAECDAMIAAAGASGAVLAAGQTRRFFNAYRLANGIFERGLLGRITSFDLREGSIYNWPVRSDFMFRRETGGGVLRDTGAHTLDALLWWLGEPAEIEYRDNARGGVESDCELRLTYPSGATGSVELSRTRNLRNTYRFTGELASLELETQLDGRVTLEVNDHPVPLAGKAPPEDVWGIFRRQLDDFGESILHRRDPCAPGADARRVVALIERCLAARQPLHFPWEADER
jgi:predicted dehydrogenase